MRFPIFLFFFFNDAPPPEISPLPPHAPLPTCGPLARFAGPADSPPEKPAEPAVHQVLEQEKIHRSEEHTSELQSHSDLVCRLLLEKKKNRHRRRQDRPTSNRRRLQHPALTPLA